MAAGIAPRSKTGLRSDILQLTVNKSDHNKKLPPLSTPVPSETTEPCQAKNWKNCAERHAKRPHLGRLASPSGSTIRMSFGELQLVYLP